MLAVMPFGQIGQLFTLMTCTTFELDDISNLINISTPIILLIWFYYSQRLTHSKDYFAELSGIYGGFLKATREAKAGGQVHAGIIMNIRDVDSRGFFKGDFDYAESELLVQEGKQVPQIISDGIYMFFGEMDYEFYFNKKRHPFKAEKNRKYNGRLFVVDRLDFKFEDYKIDNYLVAEYDIIHFREMETLKFKQTKVYRTGAKDLPESFILYKSAGFDFEPYKNVKRLVFPATRVDK